MGGGAGGFGHVQEKHLSVDWVLKFVPHIQSAPVLLLDANLAPPVLEAAARGEKRAPGGGWHVTGGDMKIGSLGRSSQP